MTIQQQSRIVCCAFIFFLSLFISCAWAAEIDGKVTAVAADTVTIRHTSDLIPNVGDKVEISFTTPDGDIIQVGTWKVSMVEGTTLEAKVEESFGPPNVDMNAKIFSDSPRTAPVLNVQPNVQSRLEDLTAEDQYQRGLDYRDNQKDYSAAAQMFSRAAEQGHVRAQACLGWAYHQGQGVPQAYTQALSWYKKAAKGR